MWIQEGMEGVASLLSMFGKELAMSTTNWSSGTCTVEGSSKYLAFIVYQNNNVNLGIREGNSVRWFGLTATGANEYIKGGNATVSGDAWTMETAVEITHAGNGNHSTVRKQAVSKIIGLIPIMGGQYAG